MPNQSAELVADAVKDFSNTGMQQALLQITMYYIIYGFNCQSAEKTESTAFLMIVARNIDQEKNC